MVYESRIVAVYDAVEVPVVVEYQYVIVCLSPPVALFLRNLLAGVFNYAPAFCNRLSCVHAGAVYSGLPDRYFWQSCFNLHCHKCSVRSIEREPLIQCSMGDLNPRRRLERPLSLTGLDEWSV